MINMMRVALAPPDDPPRGGRAKAFVADAALTSTPRSRCTAVLGITDELHTATP
jgi:hypothetical protein